MSLESHPLAAIALLLLAMAMSFLFSGMEAGVLALSRLRIRQLRRGGHERAAALHNYLEKPEDFLWTILVGNTLANLVVVGLAAAWLHQRAGQWPVALWGLFLVWVFFFYILCELLPKIVFRAFPTRLCLMFVGVFRRIHFVLQPLVALVAWVSRLMLGWTGGKRLTGTLFGNRDELRFLMQESAQNLSHEERAMINRVLDLQTLTVGQAAIPIARVTSLQGDSPIKEALALCRAQNLSRLPVWGKDGSRNRVIGILNLGSLIFAPRLDETKLARDFLQPALYLDDQVRLEEALKRMQRSGRRLAIVLGPDQVERGILSVEDILGAIFGEVRL